MGTKTITLVIEDDYADIITVTAIGRRGCQTNVNVSANEVSDGMVIRLPEKDEDGEKNG